MNQLQGQSAISVRFNRWKCQRQSNYSNFTILILHQVYENEITRQSTLQSSNATLPHLDPKWHEDIAQSTQTTRCWAITSLISELHLPATCVIANHIRWKTQQAIVQSRATTHLIFQLPQSKAETRFKMAKE